MPLSTGIDPLHQAVKMHELALRSAHDLEGALAEARAASTHYLSQGTAPHCYVHFWPVFHGENEEAALIVAESLYGVPADSYKGLVAVPEFREQAMRPIAVTRAWGMIGLMWALLLERLEGAATLGTCENCRSVIPFGRRRRFCSRAENASCFKERTRTRQKKSRARRPKK